MRRIAFLPALLLASCAQFREAEFYVNAISTQEKEIPCVVVVEDVVQTDGQVEVKTPCRITLQFKVRGDGAGFEGKKLGVKAVEVDADGKITSGLRKGETSPYKEDWRSVYPADSTRQLFILHKRRAGE